MKLLLDQGLPRTAVDELGRVGLVAVHTGAVGMAAASDEAILERARRESETVVTLDADFPRILAFTNAAAPSVIRVRIEGLRAAALAALISRVVATCTPDLEAGAIVTVDPHRVRVRRLPLVAI